MLTGPILCVQQCKLNNIPVTVCDNFGKKGNNADVQIIRLLAAKASVLMTNPTQTSLNMLVPISERTARETNINAIIYKTTALAVFIAGYSLRAPYNTLTERNCVKMNYFNIGKHLVCSSIRYDLKLMSGNWKHFIRLTVFTLRSHEGLGGKVG